MTEAQDLGSAGRRWFQSVAAAYRSAVFGRHRKTAAGILLLLMTVISYIPSFTAGYIWDDDDYVTENQTLRSPDGLTQIWFEPSASPQYYPLVFTTFWLEYQVWGLHPAGYHVVNVLLHGLCSIMLWCLLRRIGITGSTAWVAAAVFALHPVHVESVAWITERKNVLSGLFYLGSALAYQGYRPAFVRTLPWPRPRLAYALAILLFVAALLSKTVTATLPAALLLVTWWRRGSIGKNDIAPLLPMLFIGIVMGLGTAAIEREHVGTSVLSEHGELELEATDRAVIAGRAVWFYARSLVWPRDLMFNYPRWSIDPTQTVQWIYPLTFVVVVAALWAARRRIGRGPVTAVFFFAGTLFPALGFIDVFPFRYSWVADHFQYLASIGLITGIVTVGGRLATVRFGTPSPPFVRVFTAAILVLLGSLTWRQASAYHDAETLWRDTIRKNPESWIAHMHLGGIEEQAGALETALFHYQTTTRLSPRYPFGHFRVAEVLEKLKGPEAATASLWQAVEDPDAHGMVFARLADRLAANGRDDLALAPAREGIRRAPGYQYTHEVAGHVCLELGLYDEAVRHLSSALEISPMNPGNRAALGRAYHSLGRSGMAFTEWTAALRLNPNDIETRIELGRSMIMAGLVGDGVAHLSIAVLRRPGDALLRFDHGVGLALLGKVEEARMEAEVALEIAGREGPEDLIPQIRSFLGRLDFSEQQQVEPAESATP